VEVGGIAPARGCPQISLAAGRSHTELADSSVGPAMAVGQLRAAATPFRTQTPTLFYSSWADDAQVVDPTSSSSVSGHQSDAVAMLDGEEALGSDWPQPDVNPSLGPLNPEIVRQQGLTTLMLQNIPRNIHQDKLIMAINASGFQGWYNYLHLPYDCRYEQSHGYAFINFLTPDAAAAFVESWGDTNLFSGPNPLRLSAANKQGYEAYVNVKTLQRLSRLRSHYLRPFIAAPGGQDMRLVLQSYAGASGVQWHT